MAFYTDENGRIVEERPTIDKPSKKTNTTALSLAKVFGYMFAGLAITGVVAFVLAFIFNNWYMSDPEGVESTLFFLLIGSAIGVIVLTFVITFSLRKRSVKATLIPIIIYCVLMGFMLSTFVLFLDWRLLGGAFIATSLIFGVMALVSLLAKGSLNGLAIVGFGLIFGAAIMSLFTWFLSFISPETFETFYWIVSLGMFAGMMFITMWDIWRIKKIAEQGELHGNVSLYCAFQLYVDFIYIFIRMLYLLSYVTGRNN